ncbi:hypothetical protein [Kitasatospora kifunensis]|uniref:Uncharacterized protein n=1 Tax=Kitasatospora kifunensis TaxID=58351 RepID=A0A7W7RBZ7_KITKI|nr:hypothetical protein [Kitasatospora kifunensis]MBB4929178.1 hypothetical protein [Kitasatospora kifunensis]
MAPTLDPAGAWQPEIATAADTARVVELNRAINSANRISLALDETEKVHARLDRARTASEAAVAQYTAHTPQT